MECAYDKVTLDGGIFNALEGGCEVLALKSRYDMKLGWGILPKGKNTES